MDFKDFIDEKDFLSNIGSYKRASIIGIAVVFVSILALIGFNFMQSAPVEEIEVTSAKEHPSVEEEVAPSQVCVHVTGHVVEPGMYYLDNGSRVGDAIALAGGLAEDADSQSINLARQLTDGEQIFVLGMGDAATAQEAVAAVGSSDSVSPYADSSSANGKVSINKADASQLQTLDGIGQSKAQKIIDYRNSNGPFASIDDLQNVNGIGSKTLENIRSKICL